MKLFKKAIAVASALSIACAACACTNVPSEKPEPAPDLPALGTSVGYDESLRVEDNRAITPQQYTMYNTTGVDDFGRTVLTVDGKENSKRYVGMFYFLWLGQHVRPTVDRIYDISKITKDGADNNAFQVNDKTSPLDTDHHWGESAFGYYDSGDEWVMRKQVEMFVASGIDFLVFDCTNGYTYQSNVKKLLNVLLEYQNAGWNVPKIMYYLATPKVSEIPGGATYIQNLKDVYNFAYKTNKYESLWFAPNGSPMITMHQDYYNQGKDNHYGLNMNNIEESIIFNTFEFKCRQWPNEKYEANGVPWMDWTYPQKNHNGWMNVSVGQHLTIRFSDLVGTHGRGYDLTKNKNDHDRWKEDINLQSQWQTVIDNKDAVQYAFVTGWNEWTACKMYDSKAKTYFTVDTYNAEYSRDIEPSEANGDNAYLINAQKIREYNYLEAQHYIYPKTTIDITKDDPKWASIREYVDFTNDCKDRNYKTYVPTTVLPNYTDTSGRNDISTVKVARDDHYMYFRVETAGGSITTPPSDGSDKTWMNIWIKTQNGTDTYNGYHYVINRAVNGKKTTVQKASSDGTLKDCATGDLYLDGNVMIVRVALSDLDLSPTNYDIEFKVTDHVNEAEIFNYLDYYRTGDSAPIGRLNYKYGY